MAREVRIVNNANGRNTEKMYDGVYGVVETIPDGSVPFLLVKPDEQKCPLVGDIYVLRDCLVFMD